MDVYEFTVSLRIRHPNADPDEITRTLNLQPQHTWRAGEPRRDPGGGLLEGTYRESYWMGRLMDGPQMSSADLSVERVLLQTLAHLRRAQPFLAALKAGGGDVALHVSIFGRRSFALELSAESLAMLAKLGLSVAFDVHPPHAT
jgi:hypothetical protein